MYELSRDLFRALCPGLMPDKRDAGRPARTLLTLCENAVQGIAQLPAARRIHANRLFAQARPFFPPSDQRELITRIDLAVAEVHERLVEYRGGHFGGLRCAATTLRHTACMREPIAGRLHCPSHRHLEAPLETYGATEVHATR